MKKFLKNIAVAGILAVFFITVPLQYGKAEIKAVPPPGTEKSLNSSLNGKILPPGVISGDEFAPGENQPTTTVQTIKLPSTIAPRFQGIVSDGAEASPSPMSMEQFLTQGNIAPAIVRMQKIEKMLWVAIVFGALGFALGIFNLFLRRKDGLKKIDEIKKQM